MAPYRVHHLFSFKQQTTLLTVSCDGAGASEVTETQVLTWSFLRPSARGEEAGFEFRERFACFVPLLHEPPLKSLKG